MPEFLRGRRTAVLLCCLLMTGCLPESREPVTPVDEALDDRLLPGLWVTEIAGEPLFIHVLLDDQSLLQVVTVLHGAGGGGELDFYAGHASAVGDRRFASLRPVEAGMPADGGQQRPFYLLGYEFDGAGQLVARFLSTDAVGTAIEAGQIEGNASDAGEGLSVTITDDPADIAAFLAAADPATLFDQRLELRRLTPMATP